MNLKAILVVLPIILVLRAQAQNADTISPATELKKNMIYMTVGFAGLYAVVNGNYERVIAYNEKTFFKYYLVRVGGGYWGAWGGEGSLGCGIGYGYLHRIPLGDMYAPPPGSDAASGS